MLTYLRPKKFRGSGRNVGSKSGSEAIGYELVLKIVDENKIGAAKILGSGFKYLTQFLSYLSVIVSAQSFV